MNHLNNLNSVECHCLLYKFSWTDKLGQIIWYVTLNAQNPVEG